MNNWHRFSLFSMLIAAGLMLGHIPWAALGAAFTERSTTLHIAWFQPNAALEVEGTAHHPIHWTREQASWLWSGSLSLLPENLWSPALLLVQFFMGSIITFIIWAIAYWVVRLLVSRGPDGLGTPLDLLPRETRIPSWPIVLLSPLFALLAAVGFGLAATLVHQYSIRIPPPGTRGFPLEHVGWTTPALFALTTATVWGLCTLNVARQRQYAAHRARRSCSRCGYPFGGIVADKCPECGAMPPTRRHRPPRRWPMLLAVGALPFIAFLSGFAITGAVPGLVARALDRDAFLVDSGFAVDVPLHRPILIEGPWGRLHLAGAPVETGETLIRAVLTDASGNQPTHVATAVIRADTPGVRPPLNAMLAAPSIPTLTRDGLLAWVYNASFADPRSRYVQVSHFAIEPQRIRALPRNADVPAPIREVLDGTFPNAAAAERLVPPPPPP